MSDDLSFEQLSTQLHAGDPQAVAEIWNRFGPHLLREARRIVRVLGLKSYAEPEDVCQAALQALVSRPPRRGFRSESELLAFLREIIRTKPTSAICAASSVPT